MRVSRDYFMKMYANLKTNNMETTKKESWMDVQDQKILLNKCKEFMLDYVINEIDNNSLEKGKLLDKARELIVKLKNY